MVVARSRGLAVMTLAAITLVAGCHRRAWLRESEQGCGGTGPFYNAYEAAAIDLLPHARSMRPFVRAPGPGRAEVVVVGATGATVLDCRCDDANADVDACHAAQCAVRCEVPHPPIPPAPPMTAQTLPTEAPEPGARVAALNLRGQQAYDKGHYLSAARAWAEILNVLPENELNAAERENAALIALHAYRQVLDEHAVATSPDAAIEAIKEANAVSLRYTADLRRAYGAKSQPSAEIREQARWLDAGAPDWVAASAECPAAGDGESTIEAP